MVNQRKYINQKRWYDLILLTINIKPGIHYSGLKRFLEISNNPLQHNLLTLQNEGKIIVKHEGQKKRYYPSNEYSEEIINGHIEFENHIIASIKTNPGISTTDLASSLDVRKHKIYYYLTKLKKRRLIIVNKESNKPARIFLKEID